MRQLVVTRGRVSIADVPAPGLEKGRVLVRVASSCVSIGTELSGIRTSGTPLWKRALRKPALVKQFLKLASVQGIGSAASTAIQQVSASHPIGYSAAGEVIAVAPDVVDFAPGDRVACAGGQCAHHAEVISVPINLVVRVPEAVSLAHASTVALGAIALQGVRRCAPTLGESVVVVGLGLLGQLAVQLLRANGCKVIALDVQKDRCQLALSLGADAAVMPEEPEPVEVVSRITGGVGADAVVITAASSSSEILSRAFRMCRKKGRVVLVGDVGLDIARSDIYEKELDFLVSTSYGPGRYDRSFEEEGIDYPVAYVRWTETRNMAAYLEQIANGAVRLDQLVGSPRRLDEAPAVYEALKQPQGSPLCVVIQYDGAEEPAQVSQAVVRSAPSTADRIGIAVIGTGGFSRSTHLPNLARLKDRYELRAIVSRSGVPGQEVARQYQVPKVATDAAQVFGDPGVGAVLIATRHDSHAELVLKALGSGRHVLVEKPLCLTPDELVQIDRTLQAGSPGPVLQVGFNRRFSPHIRRVRELLADRRAPVMINYLMNAGRVPLDNWVHGPQGGGRNIGEACHIYDVFTFLVGAEATDVSVVAAQPGDSYYTYRDNFVATVRFRDGSVATLTYTALGSTSHSKERMTVFHDGEVTTVDNYQQLASTRAGVGLATRLSEKGHFEELEAFAAAVRSGEWAIPWWQQKQAMEIAFAVEQALLSGC